MESAHHAMNPGLLLMGPGDLVPRWFEQRPDFDPAYAREAVRPHVQARAKTGPLALARSLG